jgi:hypothetical protein
MPPFFDFDLDFERPPKRTQHPNDSISTQTHGHSFAVTRPVNPPGAEPVLTEAQLWRGLEYKDRNPAVRSGSGCLFSSVMLATYSTPYVRLRRSSR